MWKGIRFMQNFSILPAHLRGLTRLKDFVQNLFRELYYDIFILESRHPKMGGRGLFVTTRLFFIYLAHAACLVVSGHHRSQECELWILFTVHFHWLLSNSLLLKCAVYFSKTVRQVGNERIHDKVGKPQDSL